MQHVWFVPTSNLDAEGNTQKSGSSRRGAARLSEVLLPLHVRFGVTPKAAMHGKPLFLKEWPYNFNRPVAPRKEFLTPHGDARGSLVLIAHRAHRRFANAKYDTPYVAPVRGRGTHGARFAAGVKRRLTKLVPGEQSGRCAQRLHFGVVRPIPGIDAWHRLRL
jgi:hypothetical protein